MMEAWFAFSGGPLDGLEVSLSHPSIFRFVDAGAQVPPPEIHHDEAVYVFSQEEPVWRFCYRWVGAAPTTPSG